MQIAGDYERQARREDLDAHAANDLYRRWPFAGDQAPVDLGLAADRRAVLTNLDALRSPR